MKKRICWRWILGVITKRNGKVINHIVKMLYLVMQPTIEGLLWSNFVS